MQVEFHRGRRSSYLWSSIIGFLLVHLPEEASVHACVSIEVQNWNRQNPAWEYTIRKKVIHFIFKSASFM